jgi:hypothetical protein
MIWKSVVPKRMFRCFREVWHRLEEWQGCRDFCQPQYSSRNNPLLPLMLINKQLGQEIESFAVELLPTLTFCSHQHAGRFFSPTNASATPRADVSMPDVYEVHAKYHLDPGFNTYFNINRGSVETEETLLQRVLEEVLESRFGLRDIPTLDLGTTYLSKYERQRSARRDPTCRAVLGFDVRQVGMVSWKLEKKYEAKHIRCTKKTCYANDPESAPKRERGRKPSERSRR